MASTTTTNMGMSLLFFVGLSCILYFVPIANAACTRDSYSSLPSAATFPTETLAGSFVPSGRPVTKNHWSEVAKYANYRPAYFEPQSNPPQTNCPHTTSTSTLKDWHVAATWGGSVPANGSDVTLPANTRVLVSSCSAPTSIFGTITIPAGSALIFGDANIHFSARGFNVNGALQIGSPTCRLRNKVTITLYGSRPGSVAGSTVKGIAASNGGTVDIHGMQYTRTWSRLAMTAEVGDEYIFIQDMVNWQPGQSIFITSTELKDARDWHRNEERKVKKVYRTSLDSNIAAIQLDSPLSYQHYGGPEYQAEVGLISRNILVQGDPINSEPTDKTNAVCKDAWNSTYPCPNKYLTGYGGHIQIIGKGAKGRFSGLELYRMGQTNFLGRYPLHWHLIGNTTTEDNFATDCSVHNAFFRCYTIHGTSGVLLRENTAYDAIGNCFYLSENGVEEESVIQYNLGAHVHPIGNIQDPSTKGEFWGQYLDDYTASSSLLIPADMSAAPFYVTNMYITMEGNAASGGWTGFSFPNLPFPIENYKNVTNLIPANRPFKTPFRGNTAHSSGFWWASAAAFYFGGVLKYTDDTKTLLTYTAGRANPVHDTCNDPTKSGCPLANQEWLQLEDNKAFLCNRGLQSWGNRADIVRLEIHDAALSMNVFGKVWIDQMLMDCRSSHLPTWFSGCPVAPAISQKPRYVCNIRDFYFLQTIQGFQWYDVGQSHIVTDSTFRNCRSDWSWCIFGPYPGFCGSSAVFTSLSHSDQFVPQLMQATSGITLDNCNNTWRTSTSLQSNYGRTVSGMMQSWLDVDGSVSGVGSRTMIGSGWANEWWKMHDSDRCYEQAERWVCRMMAKDSSAAIKLIYDPTILSDIGDTICVNGNSDGTKPCPTVGTATHFGRNESEGVPISAMGQLTGPLIYKSGGWFLRYSAGTPKILTISEIQVSPKDVLLIALPYPADTQFNITFEAPSWCGPSWAICSHPFYNVSSVEDVVNAFGDAYYWDNSAQTLYLRVVIQNSTFGKPGTDAPWTLISPNPSEFTRHDITIPPINYGPTIVIRADCSSNPCTPQPDVVVPSQLNPTYEDNSNSAGERRSPSLLAALKDTLLLN